MLTLTIGIYTLYSHGSGAGQVLFSMCLWLYSLNIFYSIIFNRTMQMSGFNLTVEQTEMRLFFLVGGIAFWWGESHFGLYLSL